MFESLIKTEAPVPVEPIVKPSGFVQKLTGILSILLAGLAVVLTIYYCNNSDIDAAYLGGLDFGELIFNWHPILMVSGLIFCFISAAVSFRLFPLGKPINKKLHAAFHSLAIICITLGLSAVVIGNNYKDKNNADMFFPNLYSLHSFLGLCAILLYFQNWVMGLVAYLFHLVSIDIKKMYMPNHITLGVMALFAALAAVETGIMELFAENGCGYDVDSPDTNPAKMYHLMAAGCRTLNGMGLIVFLAVMCAAFCILDLGPRPAPKIEEPETQRLI